MLNDWILMYRKVLFQPPGTLLPWSAFNMVCHPTSGASIKGSSSQTALGPGLYTAATPKRLQLAHLFIKENLSQKVRTIYISKGIKIGPLVQKLRRFS